jgi:hypothetical protein
MADHQSHYFLAQLDARDSGFPRRFGLWPFEAQGEIDNAIAATREMIASSKALLDEIDRLFPKR